MRRPPRILVVEDDPDVRRVLAEVLQDEGYEVVLAVDGRDAVVKLFDADALMPMLIIFDLMMPVFDGWQFQDLLKSYTRTAKVPLIAISASNKPPPDGVKFLKKPLQLDELLVAVRETSQPNQL